MRNPDHERQKATARLLAIYQPSELELPLRPADAETEALWVVVFELQERINLLTKELEQLRRLGG